MWLRSMNVVSSTHLPGVAIATVGFGTRDAGASAAQAGATTTAHASVNATGQRARITRGALPMHVRRSVADA